MFGLHFLFVAALWALPLAALPILLHLLYRRRSPVIPFSTLRFVKSSLQHTAARRRLQRWLLLAVRALLLALLIWAVAQPAKILASRWLEPGRSLIAAIVLDTSYSMQLEERQLPLLTRADSIVQDLLRGPLSDAQVAIYHSRSAPADSPEHLQSASKIQSEWSPLKPQPALRPLIEQVSAASEMLQRQQADGKWLIILSDLQSREFPRPLEPFEGGRIVLFDLQPEHARSSGITRVAIQPDQPLPGLGSEATVEVVGRAGDSRAVTVTLSSLDGKPLVTKPPLVASFSAGGVAQLRLPVEVPAQHRWMLLTAALQGQDAMGWDDSRTQVVEVPPRQIVSLLDPATSTPAQRFMRLALDPSEGRLPSWPIDLRSGRASLTGQENVAVLALTQWPSEAVAQRWFEFVRDGGALVLCTQPGIEESWAGLSAERQAVLAELLPSAPLPPTDGGTSSYNVLPGAVENPILKGVLDGKLDLGAVTVQRFVSFATGDTPAAEAVLNLTVSATPGSGNARTHGLLFRRKVGAGTAYTLATLPESRFTSLATHPLFLPLMVSLCLRAQEQSAAQNVEIGNPLVLAGQRYAAVAQLELEAPRHERFVVPAADDSGTHQLAFDRIADAGVHTWRKPDSNTIEAISNVQFPAAESELIYRQADTIIPVGPNCIVARSMEELESKMASVSEPAPRWTGAIAVVLALLCVEALLGSVSSLWKPLSLFGITHAARRQSDPDARP